MVILPSHLVFNLYVFFFLLRLSDVAKAFIPRWSFRYVFFLSWLKCCIERRIAPRKKVAPKGRARKAEPKSPASLDLWFLRIILSCLNGYEVRKRFSNLEDFCKKYWFFRFKKTHLFVKVRIIRTSKKLFKMDFSRIAL